MPTKSLFKFIRNERKRITDRCSSNRSTKEHLNTFDDILHLNGYPRVSIVRTKHPQNRPQNPNLATQNGHILRSPTSLNNSITGSLTFSEKKTSHYALHTNPTHSEKPHLTPPQSANALERHTLSLTLNYAYEEM